MLAAHPGSPEFRQTHSHRLLHQDSKGQISQQDEVWLLLVHTEYLLSLIFF